MQIKSPVDVKTKQRTWLRRTLASHMKSSIVIPALGAALMIGAPMIANAADFHVTDEATLQSAINTADNGDNIIFDNDITLTQDLPPISKSVTIEGTSFTLNAAGFQSLYIGANADPNVQNLTVTNGGTGGIFSNAVSALPSTTSLTLNGGVAFNGSADINGNVELNVQDTGNSITNGVSLSDESSLNVVDITFGDNVASDNSLTSNVQINSGDATVTIGGALTNINIFAFNISSVNNTLTGNVTDATGVGGFVDIGSGIATANDGSISINTVANLLTGNVSLDGATSHVFVGDNAISDGFVFGNVNGSISINTVNNTIDGNVTLTNGGNVDLGRNAADETISTITVDSEAGSAGINTIANEITGYVTVTNGNVNFNGGSFNTSNDLGGGINSITNRIGGNVIVNGTGNLNFAGDYDTSNDNGSFVVNAVENTIGGSATLNDTSDSLVKGANNTITAGLTLNTTTSDLSGEATTLTIGGGDTAITDPVLNQLTVNGTGVVVNGNPNSYNNIYNQIQRPSDHQYDIDSGRIIVGAIDSSNTADNQSIENVLEGNVTLNGIAGTDVDGNNNWRNSGGAIVLGFSENDLSNGASVTNKIDGTVALHGGSRMFVGGDRIIGDGDSSNSVTNTISGAVTADGNSYIAMGGQDDDRLHNILDDSLTLSDNALFVIGGVGNTISGGTFLEDKSIAQVGGGILVNELTSDFTLNDNSQLQLGSSSEYANFTAGLINHIDGDVTLNDDAQLKVLSGGSGGTNSAPGSSSISGDLTLSSGNTFIVNAGLNPTITGLQVDGAGGAHLGDAKVQVNLFNVAMNFGQRYSLVEAINGRNGVFNPDVVTADSDGDARNMPFLLWETGYTPTSAYLTLLTQFNNAGHTDNQRSFGQYLDNLVSDAAPGGVTDGTDDNDLYDTLQYLAFQDNPNALDNFTGDSYAAFDLAGYWNSSRFSDRVALHALQSRDSDWTQSFALNASQGLSGAGSQMSLVKQMLYSRPALQLSANATPAMNNSAARSGIWGDVAGDWLSNDGDSGIGSPDFDLNSKSVVLGYQGGSQKFTWGIAGGYHNGDLDFNNRAASGDVDGWNVGLNGLWKANSGVYLNGVLAYSKDSNTLKRENLPFAGNKSDFNSHAISAQLELGKRFDHGKNVNFTPYLSLLGMKYDRDSVRESGSGAGLNVGDASNSFFTSNLGVRVGRDFIDAKDGSKRGGLMLGVSWQHQFSDVNFPVTAALQNAAPGSSFQVQGTPLSKNGIGVQLGGYGRLSKNILGFLNYSGSFSSNQKVNSVTAGVEYQF